MSCSGGGGQKGVEIARTIAAKNHASGLKILDTETERIKFNSVKIVTSKLLSYEQLKGQSEHCSIKKLDEGV